MFGFGTSHHWYLSPWVLLTNGCTHLSGGLLSYPIHREYKIKNTTTVPMTSNAWLDYRVKYMRAVCDIRTLCCELYTRERLRLNHVMIGLDKSVLGSPSLPVDPCCVWSRIDNDCVWAGLMASRAPHELLSSAPICALHTSMVSLGKMSRRGRRAMLERGQMLQWWPQGQQQPPVHTTPSLYERWGHRVVEWWERYVYVHQKYMYDQVLIHVRKWLYDQTSWQLLREYALPLTHRCRAESLLQVECVLYGHLSSDLLKVICGYMDFSLPNKRYVKHYMNARTKWIYQGLLEGVGLDRLHTLWYTCMEGV